MSKLYKVRLLAHAGQQRRRGGLTLEKGVPQTVELTKANLEALEADEFIQVKEAGESEGGEQTTTPPAPKRAELDARAVELGLNPKDYKNIEQVTTAIEEAEKALENQDDDEEEDEDVVLTDLSIDDLKVIATELELNTADYADEDADTEKLKLIEAIEAKKATEV